MVWRLQGMDFGGRFHDVDVEVFESDDPRHDVLRRAQEFAELGGLIDTLAQDLESDGVLAGVDPIAIWGETAAELVGGVEFGSGLEAGVVAHLEDGEPLTGLTWYQADQIVAMTNDLPELIVADVSSLHDVEIVDVDNVTADVDELFGYDHEAAFEWRAYVGSGTLIAEGTAPFATDGQTQTRRAVVPLIKGRAALLVGRVVRWLGRTRTPARDPAFHGRLRHFETRYPEAARMYPDLRSWARNPSASLVTPEPGATMIFIHGTFSCALPTLAEIGPQMQAFRFEHDTFESVIANATELAGAATALPGPDPLFLVAHSRGGLVARQAARMLVDDGYPVSVHTYGTPHLGTPLANAGARAMELLLGLGRSVFGVVDPVSAGFKRLIRSRELPEGLSIMRTDSDVLASWAATGESFPLVAFGGEYDIENVADGRGQFARGAFGGHPNDLVVPLHSSTGAGDGRPVEGSCDHFQYFTRAELVDQLRTLE